MKRYKRMSLLIALVIALLLVAACSQSSDLKEESPIEPKPQATTDQVKAEKKLTIGIVNAPVTLNQINTQDNSASLATIALLNDALLDVTDSAEFVP